MIGFHYSIHSRLRFGVGSAAPVNLDSVSFNLGSSKASVA